jgi:hypothetical protein
MQHALQSLKFCMVTSASRRQRTQRNPVAFGPNVYCIYKRFLLTRSYRNSCSGKQTSASGRSIFISPVSTLLEVLRHLLWNVQTLRTVVGTTKIAQLTAEQRRDA